MWDERNHPLQTADTSTLIARILFACHQSRSARLVPRVKAPQVPLIVYVLNVRPLECIHF